MKGISPLIATVLLIAFTVTIGTIIASWTSTFAQTQTTLTGERATVAIKCSFGDMKVDKVTYNHTATRIAVWLKNQAGETNLANITFSALMKNASTFIYTPSPSEDLKAGEIRLYTNSTITDGCNIDKIFVSSNCPDAKDSKTGQEIEMTGC